MVEEILKKEIQCASSNVETLLSICGVKAVFPAQPQIAGLILDIQKVLDKYNGDLFKIRLIYPMATIAVDEVNNQLVAIPEYNKWNNIFHYMYWKQMKPIVDQRFQDAIRNGIRAENLLTMYDEIRAILDHEENIRRHMIKTPTGFLPQPIDPLIVNEPPVPEGKDIKINVRVRFPSNENNRKNHQQHRTRYNKH